MKIFNRTFCLFLLIVTLASCEKEKSFDTSTLGSGGGGAGNTNNILGNWKFMGVTAKTESALTGIEPGVGTVKTVTFSEYTSTNNVGTITIEAAKMTGNGLAYDVNTVAKGFFYENNILIDSLELPLAVSIPPTNSVSNYKRIGSDSLYFDGGSFFTASTGNAGPSTPTGAKIKFEGNKLLMTMGFNQTATIDTLGLRFNQVSRISIVATLQRP